MTVNYTPEQFEEYKAKYSRLKYVKTDKNGTQYYDGVCECPRCCGHGIVYKAVINGERVPCEPDSGICYRCGGSRVIDATIKVFTPEHAEKLAKQRAKKNPMSVMTAEERIEFMRQKHVQENKERGYKPIDFTLDEWAGQIPPVYKIYRVVHETEKAILIRCIYDYTEYEGYQAHENWYPKKAIHFKEV